VFDAPAADSAARSTAEVGFAIVLEKQVQQPGAQPNPLLRKALEHYLNVLDGKNLRDSENPDPFWQKKAGLEACRVAEALELWPQAYRICKRLQDMLPPLRASLENKILKLEERMAPANN